MRRGRLPPRRRRLRHRRRRWDRQPPPPPTPPPPAQPTPQPTPTPVVEPDRRGRGDQGHGEGAAQGDEDVRRSRRNSGHPDGFDDRHPKRPGRADFGAQGRRSPEKAQFYDGLFKVTQSKGITILTLTEVLDCSKGKGAGGRAEEAQEAQALGRRQGRVPHRGQVQRRDRPRHAVAGGGHVREDHTKVEVGSVTVEDKTKKRRGHRAPASATWRGRRSEVRRLAIAVLGAAGFSAAPAHAATFQVNTTVDDGVVQRGQRARCAARFRPPAATPEADMINVPAGTYARPGTSSSASTGQVTIIGAGRESDVIRAVRDDARVQCVAGAGTTSGLTIAGGRPTRRTGGNIVVATGGARRSTACGVTDGQAARGGGIRPGGGTITSATA